MILVVRKYEVDNPSGGRMRTNVTRKVFADHDIDGVQKFLDERSTINGYEWYNLSFDFIKL